MAALPLKGYAINKSDMEYYRKFGYAIGRIKHISLMSRIDICYTTCCLATQTVEPTLPGL